MNNFLSRCTDAIVVGIVAFTAWFALLFTGTVRMDWLTRRLGVTHLGPGWTRLVFFGPPLVCAVLYLVFASQRTLSASEGASRGDMTRRL